MLKGKIVREAFFKSLPIMAGYLLLGAGFGILLRDAGYGLPWALAMSLLMYSGTMQYMGVSLIAAPAGLLTTILTTLMINARHLFYAISMIGKYKGAGKWKPYLMFAMTDETYALLSVDPREDKDRFFFYFMVSLFNQSYWILGGALGSLFAAALPFSTRGLDFSMTALFVAAFTDQLRQKDRRLSALLGLGVTLLARLLCGKDIFLIPAMAGITLTLLLLRKKLSGKEDKTHEA